MDFESETEQELNGEIHVECSDLQQLLKYPLDEECFVERELVFVVKSKQHDEVLRAIDLLDYRLDCATTFIEEQDDPESLCRRLYKKFLYSESDLPLDKNFIQLIKE